MTRISIEAARAAVNSAFHEVSLDTLNPMQKKLVEMRDKALKYIDQAK